MFQGVHLQKCGEVLRYLGSDTSFTSRLPPGVELNGSSTTLLGAATLVVVSNGSLCDLLVCGVALVSIIEMITKTPVTNFTFFTGLLVYRCHRVVVTIEFPRQILRQLYLF
jgi:hypothetical protein